MKQTKTPCYTLVHIAYVIFLIMCINLTAYIREGLAYSVTIDTPVRGPILYIGLMHLAEGILIALEMLFAHRSSSISAGSVRITASIILLILAYGFFFGIPSPMLYEGSESETAALLAGYLLCQGVSSLLEMKTK